MGARVVRSKKTVENLFVRIRGNADAIIADGEARPLAFHAEIDFDSALRIGILHGVVDDVQNQFSKAELITVDRRRLNGPITTSTSAPGRGVRLGAEYLPTKGRVEPVHTLF